MYPSKFQVDEDPRKREEMTNLQAPKLAPPPCPLQAPSKRL